MQLIEIFLPLYDNDGNAFDPGLYRRIREELAEKFGGITAHTRAPAQGEMREGAQVARDDIVIYEVMVDSMDRAWWTAYRTDLEKTFAQDRILLRATQVEIL